MGLTVNGRKGEIRRGYKVVATITRYRYETNPQGEALGWHVEGDIAGLDRFYAERGGPFDLILAVGESRALWKGADIALGEGTFSASGRGTPETLP